MLTPSRPSSAGVFSVHVVHSVFPHVLGSAQTGIEPRGIQPVEALLQFQGPRHSDASEDRINVLRVASSHYSVRKGLLLGGAKHNPEEHR